MQRRSRGVLCTTAHMGKYVGGHEGKDMMPENIRFDINICVAGPPPVL